MDVSAKNPQILQNVPNEEKFSGGITLQIKSWRQNLLKKGKRKKEQNSFFSLVLIRSGVCHIHQNSHTLSLQQGELAILPPDKMYAVERYDADSIIETICLKPTLNMTVRFMKFRVMTAIFQKFTPAKRIWRL